jgi:hypothetical protein
LAEALTQEAMHVTRGFREPAFAADVVRCADTGQSSPTSDLRMRCIDGRRAVTAVRLRPAISGPIRSWDSPARGPVHDQRRIGRSNTADACWGRHAELLP